VRQSGLKRGVRVQISEEEMSIQKGAHHSDSHLFLFSQSDTRMKAGTGTSTWPHLRRGMSIFQFQSGSHFGCAIE